MFSLGCLIYAVFNSGKTLLKTRNNLLTYRNQAERLSTLPLDDTPQYFEGTPVEEATHKASGGSAPDFSATLWPPKRELAGRLISIRQHAC